MLHQSALKPSQIEMVEVIHDSAQSLLTIIDDILDFSKIEAGKLGIELSPMELGEVVEKACLLFESVAANKMVGFTYFIDPGFHRSRGIGCACGRSGAI